MNRKKIKRYYIDRKKKSQRRTIFFSKKKFWQQVLRIAFVVSSDGQDYKSLGDLNTPLEQSNKE